MLDDGDWHPVDPTYGCEHAALHIRLNAADEPAPTMDRLDELTVEVERWDEEHPPAVAWLAWAAAAVVFLVGMRYCFEFKEPPTPVIALAGNPSPGNAPVPDEEAPAGGVGSGEGKE